VVGVVAGVNQMDAAAVFDGIAEGLQQPGLTQQENGYRPDTVAHLIRFCHLAGHGGSKLLAVGWLHCPTLSGHPFDSVTGTIVIVCGRFAMNQSTDELIVEFVADGGDFTQWRPGWNIRPTDQVATVIGALAGGTVTRRLEPARWALTPGWSKTLKTAVPMFNARSEGITEKPSFRAAVASHRALIPASGYYEWLSDPQTRKKTPYLIRPAGGETMAFAGIYSLWRDRALPDDDPNARALTVTILTANSVHALAHIHDRNPVPLPRDWWDDWLNPTITGDQSFVDAAVAAAVSVAQALQIVQIEAPTDNEPLEV